MWATTSRTRHPWHRDAADHCSGRSSDRSCASRSRSAEVWAVRTSVVIVAGLHGDDGGCCFLYVPQRRNSSRPSHHFGEGWFTGQGSLPGETAGSPNSAKRSPVPRNVTIWATCSPVVSSNTSAKG